MVPSLNPWLLSPRESNSRHIPNGGGGIQNSKSVLKDIKIMKNLRNCHSQGGPKEMYWANVEWDPKPDPGAGRSIEYNRRMCKSSTGYSCCGLVSCEKEITPMRCWWWGSGCGSTGILCTILANFEWIQKHPHIEILVFKTLCWRNWQCRTLACWLWLSLGPGRRWGLRAPHGCRTEWRDKSGGVGQALSCREDWTCFYYSWLSLNAHDLLS